MVFIYNLIFIILMGMLFRKKLNNNRKKGLFLFICFFQMFLIQALRATYVGSDTIQYVEIYNKFGNSQYYKYKLTHYEIGVQALIKLLYKFGFDAQFMLAAMSAIIMIGFAVYIYYNSENLFISTFIFATLFYPNSFNVVRQYISMAIALNSFYFFNNHKYIKGVLLVIIASLFHTSILLLLIPQSLGIIKNKKFIRNTLILFNSFVLIFGTFFSNYILSHVHNSYYSASEFVKNDIFSLTTFLTFIYALIFYYYSVKRSNEKVENVLNVYTYVALSNLAFGILYLKNEIFSRFVELFNSHLIVSVSIIESEKQDRYRQITRAFFYVVPIIWMLLMVFASNAGVSKYGFFFEK